MIYLLIVIYNKKLTESKSYNFIKRYSNLINIIIFDNSNLDYINFNKDYCLKNNIQYYTNGKNIGLSKAYNFVIKKIKLSKSNYLILLDDDTILNDNYINDVFNTIKENKYDVIFPVVKTQKGIISPSKIQFNCRIKKIKNFNNLSMNNISAINSGMVVRTSVYNKIKYNENLFLDYVDHYFMMEVRKNNFAIKLLQNSINQNFSRFQKNNLDSEIERFKIYLKDFKTYCSDCNCKMFYYISTFKYRIHQVIKYKNIKFIFIK